MNYHSIISKEIVRVRKRYRFATSRGWICMVSTEEPSDEPGQFVERRYEYGDGERWPELKVIERWIFSERDPTHRELNMRLEFTKYERIKDGIDESRCRLSAFGFPEPAWVKKPRPWYVWFLVAGIVSLLAGAAVYRLRRRWSTSTH